MEKKYSAIIWDYNGTLIDDVHTALLSVNDILRRRSMEPITIEQYYSYIGTPIIKFYEHLFDLNEVPFDTLAQEFAQGYDKHLPEEPLMANARLVLALARDMELKQVILSSSHREEIAKSLNRLNIAHYFDCVSGADDYEASCKAQRGRQVLERLRIAPERAVLVGDSLHDYTVARQLGTDCVLLAKGHQGRADLLTAGVPVIDDLLELGALL